MVSALIKPRSKSVWITPAACRGRGTLANRPSADLDLTGGEEALQAEQLVCGLGQDLEAGALKPQISQELGGLLGIELGELRLDLGADRNGLHTVDCVEVLGEHVLVDVGDVEHRLHGQQEQALGGRALLIGHLHRDGTVALVQPLNQTLCHRKLGGELGVALGFLLEFGKLLFERLNIGQDELGHDGLGIARRVDELARVIGLAHDIRVLEVTDHLADGIALADVGQELVAQACALGSGALHQTSDVDELNGGREDASGVHDLCERVQAVVRHVDDADVRVDRGEGIVRGQTALLGESGEQRGLAHVGQTDDSDGKCHGIPLLKAQRRKRCVYVNLAIIDRKGP